MLLKILTAAAVGGASNNGKGMDLSFYVGGQTGTNCLLTYSGQSCQ